jgi:ligand-binding sensor domain-containing protein
MRGWSWGAVALAVAVGIASATTLFALDSRRDLSQYGHDVWGEGAIQAMVQTRDGYVWLGTQQGLMRFDGLRFTVYDRQTVRLMRSNSVLALCEDRAGGLWLGMESGGALRLKDGRFTALTAKDGLAAERVTCLFEDTQGDLWLGTEGAGVYLLRGGRLTRYGTSNGVPGEIVYDLRQDGAGRIWVATNRGVVRQEGNRFEPVELPSKGRNWYYAMAMGEEGEVWIASFKGLYRWRDGSVRRYATRDGLCDDDVQALYFDATTHSLWAGTNSGLNRIRDGRIESYTSADGLSNDEVTALMGDREGSLWIGTMSGLNRLADTKFLTIGVRRGLPSPFVSCVSEATDGALWVGMANGGAVRIVGGKTQHIGHAQGLPGKSVDAILAEPDGTVWLATDSGGPARWRDGHVTLPFARAKDLVDAQILCMFDDGQGTLWAGAAKGLIRLRGADIRVFTSKDGLLGRPVTAIEPDGAGGLWLGTDVGGLSHYTNGRFTAYTVRDGLADNIVNALYREASGRLWVGTSGGLSCLKDGKLTSFTSKDGLYDDTIYSILEDGAGRLWIGCEKGVFRVDKRLLEARAAGRTEPIVCTSYDRSDGMGASQCSGGSQPAAWRGANGMLYFATPKGVAAIDPASIPLNSRPPPVVIEAMVVDGRSLADDAPVVLPPGRHRVEFHYSALSLIAPEKARFRFILRGFENEWWDSGTRREAAYTNLGPGSYRFSVIACNSDGVWNNKGASWAFEIKPFFYQTRLFLLLCGSGLAILYVGLHRFRLRQVLTRNAILKERARIAAEIHDTLAQILTGIRLHLARAEEVLPGDAAEAHSHLAVARALTRSCTEDTRAAIAALRPYAAAAAPFPDALRGLAETLASAAGMEVSFELSGKPYRLSETVEHELWHITQEAVTNAARHSHGRHLRLSLAYDHRVVRLCVADDGVGIPTQPATTDSGTFGLTALYQRNRRRRLRVKVESQPGMGTQVYAEAHLGWAAAALWRRLRARTRQEPREAA